MLGKILLTISNLREYLNKGKLLSNRLMNAESASEGITKLLTKKLNTECIFSVFGWGRGGGSLL